MERKGTSLKESLDDTELDRLSFLVYKKAMALIGYTGTVLALGLVLFAIFGFDKWKNLSATVDELEERTTEVKKGTDTAKKGLEELKKDINEELKGNQALLLGILSNAQIETGKMQQMGVQAAGIEERIDRRQEAVLQRIEGNQKEARGDLNAGLATLRKEVDDSARSRADVERNSAEAQVRVEQASAELSDQMARARDSGNMVLVLQDKHSTAISANTNDFNITLGDASKDQITKVEIEYDGRLAAGGEKIKPSDPKDRWLHFTLTDPDGKAWEYTFKIRQINMLALRDLVTCDLSWERKTDIPAGQVARAGS